MELVVVELDLRFIDRLCAQRVEADVSICKELCELLGQAEFVI